MSFFNNPIRNIPHDCSYLNIYISQKIRLCVIDLESQFQTSLQASIINFLTQKFNSIILIFLLFFAGIVKSTVFVHCTVTAILSSWNIGIAIWRMQKLDLKYFAYFFELAFQINFFVKYKCSNSYSVHTLRTLFSLLKKLQSSHNFHPPKKCSSQIGNLQPTGW